MFTLEVSQKEKNKYRMLTHIYGILKKNGSKEPRGRTGIKMQTQRMDLRRWGGGRVSWDEVREWHGLMYTTKCKIDSQWEATPQHREVSSVLCDHLEGWDKGGWEGDARGRRYGDICICICIADSLRYKAETNIPLSSNYTPIKMLNKNKYQKKNVHSYKTNEKKANQVIF